MVPLQARRMRLHRTSTRDTDQLGEVLGEISEPFGSRVEYGDDNTLELVHQTR
jgi:hypothetical protein